MCYPRPAPDATIANIKAPRCCSAEGEGRDEVRRFHHREPAKLATGLSSAERATMLDLVVRRFPATDMPTFRHGLATILPSDCLPPDTYLNGFDDDKYSKLVLSVPSSSEDQGRIEIVNECRCLDRCPKKISDNLTRSQPTVVGRLEFCTKSSLGGNCHRGQSAELLRIGGIGTVTISLVLCLAASTSLSVAIRNTHLFI